MVRGRGVSESTEELIERIVADAPSRACSPQTLMWMAVAAAVIVATTLFGTTLEPRPDLATALATPRVAFKLVTMAALVAGAFLLVRLCVYPEAGRRTPVHVLLPVALVLSMGVIAELFTVPSVDWAARTIGEDPLLCLTAIPLLGGLPLLGFIAALRHGAPTRPGMAGALAGVLAGAIAATIYAAHCPNDSPLFIAIWYPLGIAALALAGAAAGRLLIRW